MKNQHFFQSVCILLMSCIIFSCSSPESDGKKAAQKYCDCEREKIEELQQNYVELIEKFESYHFQTRVEVREKLDEFERTSTEKYNRCQQVAEEYYQKVNEKYSSNCQENEKFKYAFTALQNVYLQEQRKIDNSELLSQIDRRRLTIIPSKPNEEKIKKDLVGRTIIEPTRKLYRDKFDVQSIEKISKVTIMETRNIGNDINYSVHVDLNGDVNKYIANINITYYLGENDDWTIQYIESEQLDILPTGKYDNCITANLVESGWGIIRTVKFGNKCDVTLLVEGVAFYNNEWQNFHALIDANDSREANTGFADIKDFKIQRVERP